MGVVWTRFMKLRLQSNSVRLRLTRSEVERLRDTGLVEESVDFGGGEVLAYRLLSQLEPGPVQARFRQGTVTVFGRYGSCSSLGGFGGNRRLCAIRCPRDFD